MDKLQKENTAIVFFNANSTLRLSIMLTGAIKQNIRDRIFIEKDLESALVRALKLNGLPVDSDKTDLNKRQSLLNKIDRYVNKDKYERIEKLELKIQELKRQREINVHNIFSMLSRISWDENFEPIHLEGIEKDESYIELYKAIELLHKDIKELSKRYYTDS
jgi:tetrahydrodipicolinate N-succinyltransferase